MIEQLERLNPVAPVGVHLATFQDAIDLLAWARTVPEFTCRVSDRIDGSFEVQIEGVNVATAKAGEGQWIVLDDNKFVVLSPEEWANTYKVAGT